MSLRAWRKRSACSAAMLCCPWVASLQNNSDHSAWQRLLQCLCSCHKIAIMAFLTSALHKWVFLMQLSAMCFSTFILVWSEPDSVVLSWMSCQLSPYLLSNWQMLAFYPNWRCKYWTAQFIENFPSNRVAKVTRSYIHYCWWSISCCRRVSQIHVLNCSRSNSCLDAFIKDFN